MLNPNHRRLSNKKTHTEFWWKCSNQANKKLTLRKNISHWRIGCDCRTFETIAETQWQMSLTITSTFITWINANTFLDPFSIRVTFSRIDLRAKNRGKWIFAKQQEPTRSARTIGNYEVENDTRVPKCLSLVSAFDTTAALDYRKENKKEKKKRKISKKSRWPKWLIISTCLCVGCMASAMPLKSHFFRCVYDSSGSI